MSAAALGTDPTMTTMEFNDDFPTLVSPSRKLIKEFDTSIEISRELEQRFQIQKQVHTLVQSFGSNGRNSKTYESCCGEKYVSQAKQEVTNGVFGTRTSFRGELNSC